MIPDLRALPGGERVTRGLRDLGIGATETPCALLVQIGRPRLAAAGIGIASCAAAGGDAELRLYAELVADQQPDPCGRHNALIRRLVSCESALEQPLGAELRRQQATRGGGKLGR